MKKTYLLIFAVVITLLCLVFYSERHHQISPTHTSSYINMEYGFQVDLPLGTEAMPLKEEGVVIGDSVIVGGIKIYLPSSLGRESNPKAQSLTDYMADYQSPYLAVKIHNQTKKVTGNFTLLRQEYSTGTFVNGVFKSDKEYGTDHGLRYIFDNGKGTIIILPISSKENFDYLDSTANSFKFI